MSLEGFYRTVIHAILASHPRLVERSLPLRWQAHELFGETRRPWSTDELKVAFLYLLNLSGKEFKLCLFVDGLDEYGGDHNAFADEIFDMTNNSAVKLCLASRPWPVFDYAFSRKSHLMLQNLTFPDIVRFTWTNFSCSHAFRSRLDTESDFLGDLVLQVAHKSEGVFLWVHLVVKSLLEGITNADRVEDLQERLNELPGDLEELYWKMFQSIEPRYCAHASRYFQISLAASGQMSAFAFFLADSGDPSSSLSSPIQPISNDRRLQAYHAIKTRLASRCMGLLEIPLPQPTSQIVRNEPSEFHQAEQSMHAPGRNTGSRTQPQSVDGADLEISPALGDIPAVSEPDRKVTFLHRTVKDFLERPDVRSEIVSVGPTGFNPYLPMLGGYLRLLKTLRDEQVDRHTLLEFASTYLELVADAERQSCPIQDEYIDTLDVVLTKLFLKYHLLPPGHHWTETRTTDTEPGFVAMTAEFNLGRYIRTKISTGSPVFQHTIERPLLDYVIQNCDKYPVFCENPTRPDGPLPSLEMITFMLDQKANPNDPYADSTVWGRFFDKVFEDWTATKSSERLEHWAIIVDVLISHDADPRVNQDSPLGSKIRETFGSVFPERARAFEKRLNRTKRRWSRLGRFITPRNQKQDRLTINPTPLPVLQRLESAEEGPVSRVSGADDSKDPRSARAQPFWDGDRERCQNPHPKNSPRVGCDVPPARPALRRFNRPRPSLYESHPEPQATRQLPLITPYYQGEDLAHGEINIDRFESQSASSPRLSSEHDRDEVHHNAGECDYVAPPHIPERRRRTSPQDGGSLLHHERAIWPKAQDGTVDLTSIMASLSLGDPPIERPENGSHNPGSSSQQHQDTEHQSSRGGQRHSTASREQQIRECLIRYLGG
ncbi:ankyrin repeat domain-containing protein 50 [Microdochium nivale]|nr:ankyrin repeat domain-containing protein 50 [Microdochium nivale]